MHRIDIPEHDRLRLSSQQQEIYNGLSSIGEEIAAFYLDGTKIIRDQSLETASYLLGHILREIEGGLRDVLVVDKKESEKCSECNQPKPRTEGHIDSICEALGADKDHPLARKWHDVAKKFWSYAHRHGAWKPPRPANEVVLLWEEFEEVLYAVVGTFLNLSARLKSILQRERPSGEIISALPNLLSNEALDSYFFGHLRSKHWLIPLKSAGFFDPRNNPCPQEVPDKEGYFRIPHWSVLSYLEVVSKENRRAPGTTRTTRGTLFLN